MLFSTNHLPQPSICIKRQRELISCRQCFTEDNTTGQCFTEDNTTRQCFIENTTRQCFTQNNTRQCFTEEIPPVFHRRQSHETVCHRRQSHESVCHRRQYYETVCHRRQYHTEENWFLGSSYIEASYGAK